MDVRKRRAKRKRSPEKTADEYVEVRVPLFEAEEVVDNGKAKENQRPFGLSRVSQKEIKIYFTK